MKTGWLIYKKDDAVDNDLYIDWFIKEAERQKIVLHLILREDLLIGVNGTNYITSYLNKSVNLPDFCVIRTIDHTLQAHFEAQNILCFNNYYTSVICNDKSATHIEMAKLEVASLKTFHFDFYPTRLPLPFPFVLKAINGRGGRDVFLIKNQADYLNIQDHTQLNQFVMQATDVQVGKDLRVFVIGKKIIAAVLRENKNDFRANFKLGGRARLYHLNKKEIQMINKIISHFDFGLVGIDFLINHDGELLFNEIEDVVGSRILSETTDINLLELYVLYINSFLK